MKKRLLISSVLMSAVLACALGTGTYAWYYVGSASAQGATDSVANLSTAANGYSAGGITFTPDLAVTGSPKLTNNSGQVWYFLGEGTSNKAQDTSAQLSEKFGSGSVSITGAAAAEGASYSEIMATLVGKAVKVVVNSTDANVKFFASQPTAETVDWSGSTTWEKTVVLTEETPESVLEETSFYWGYKGLDDTRQEQVNNITFTATVTVVSAE